MLHDVTYSIGNWAFPALKNVRTKLFKRTGCDPPGRRRNSCDGFFEHIALVESITRFQLKNDVDY